MPTLPPHDPVQITLQRQIRELQREIRLLKEKPRPEDNPAQRRTEITFSYHGEVTAGERSGAYLVKDFQATIHRVDWTANTAGSGDSVCQVLVNGDVAYEFAMEGGEETGVLNDLAIDVEEWDRLRVEFDSVGAGLETVVLTFQVVALDEEAYD